MTAQVLTKDWDDFSPRAYLDEYYADIGGENDALLRFYVEVYKQISPDSILLDFSGGPTIYPLIAAAEKVKEIHFSDYLETNLAETRKWLQNDETAFDWRGFVQRTLEIEHASPCSPAAVIQREAAIRQRVTRLITCDVTQPCPIVGASQHYDIVVSNFCAESATDDRDQWLVFVQNILSLLKPGGQFILTALKGARHYSVGTKIFPAVEIDEQDLIQTLGLLGCLPDSIRLRSVPVDRPARHYHGLMFAVATKQGKANHSRITEGKDAYARTVQTWISHH